MRHLHILVDNETYDKLKKMSVYHGEMSNIIRVVLQNFVNSGKSITSTTDKIIEKFKAIEDKGKL